MATAEALLPNRIFLIFFLRSSKTPIKPLFCLIKLVFAQHAVEASVAQGLFPVDFQAELFDERLIAVVDKGGRAGALLLEIVAKVLEQRGGAVFVAEADAVLVVICWFCIECAA
ncbi:MAG: hypothetical protein K9M54_06190 [Kiritimatiellales bacterium]|nr:hypothetical protein [Kiritimatiellales bacterium]MCF7864391.1 hypothetical protein [Kiritimatiellales bacterium]